MTAPLIGIVSNFRRADNEYYLPSAYIDAVLAAGGRPIILPYGTEADAAHHVGLLDGLLLTGGTDFSPELYGGRHHPAMSDILSNRDDFEICLTHIALASSKPILAICRGMQLVNVLRGGTIFDHTLDQRECPTDDHRTGAAIGELVHDVEIIDGSRLHAICRTTRLPVNSMHHQAIDRLGDSLVISALAPDGVIEALEDPRHPFLLAIQWHPEQRQKDEPNKRIIEAFITACTQDTLSERNRGANL
ncbi:putative glutamine amidotransferase [Rhodoligotrophos appendicifer]|uniref:gamma-glutamyl-gamma-aminobutyrate hydrolase family protein n=1 Tax=Rhodoligotrophos appendicifer TaxID=987056 RepID=UPI0011865C49|nr:gamma-glutamyl-gamma-aminobutyrate hydrolase family protein [Rhodoligotrophos appendicifer]